MWRLEHKKFAHSCAALESLKRWNFANAKNMQMCSGGLSAASDEVRCDHPPGCITTEIDR